MPKSFRIFLATIFTLATTTSVWAQGIPCHVFVDARASAATADGSSWATAYPELRDALRATGYPDSDTNVCVAAGTYTPSRLEENATFELRNHVHLYGGFAGNEISPFDLRERELAVHQTILDGRGISDNVLRCPAATCDGPVTIDGFTVTGGIGGGTGGPSLSGGGLYNVLGMLWLSNVVFVKNRAHSRGGAVFNVAGTLSLTNVVFDDNAANDEGGALYSHSGKVTIANAVFYANSVRRGGGGALASHAETDVSNAVFLENSAPYGGAVVSGHWFTLANSIVWSNATVMGTQIFVNPALASVTHSIIEDNDRADNIAYAGSANVGDDPLFLNAGNPAGPDGRWGTSDDGLIPRADSPAVNAGTLQDVFLLETDLRGGARLHGPSVDVGPYEFDPSLDGDPIGDTKSTYVEEAAIPDRTSLDQNHPNPFHPNTWIRFTLSESAHVRLSVHDVVGREVDVMVDGSMPAGTHEILFRAGHLSSGVYTYVLHTGRQRLLRTMVLAK